jgi:hypothetical protein
MMTTTKMMMMMSLMRKRVKRKISLGGRSSQSWRTMMRMTRRM